MAAEPFISVTIDERSFAEAQRILRAIPRGADRAIARGLNRTVASARTHLSRLVSRRIGSRVGDVRSRIFARKAYWNKPIATLDVSTDRKQLIDLGAVQMSRGVMYRPFGRGKNKLIEHAFIAEGSRRGRQVWLRSVYVLGRRKHIEWQGRRMEALYLQKGASLLSLITAEDRQSLTEKASREVGKNVDDQVGVELRRWANKGR